MLHICRWHTHLGHSLLLLPPVQVLPLVLDAAASLQDLRACSINCEQPFPHLQMPPNTHLVSQQQQQPPPPPQPPCAPPPLSPPPSHLQAAESVSVSVGATRAAPMHGSPPATCRLRL